MNVLTRERVEELILWAERMANKDSHVVNRKYYRRMLAGFSEILLRMPKDE